MQITRNNYSQYASMVQQMLGNKKGSGNLLALCDYGNFALRFKPVDIRFTKPNWDNIMTKRDKPAMSEEEFEEAIKELARKEFSTGKRDDAAYRKLCMQHGETVSPDRKAIYEESMRKTGGKMNAACMFWDSKGNKTLSYNPESRNWKAISTEEEFARARLFTSIYNDEIKRLQKEYGENAKGTVSYQQIQSDLEAVSKMAGQPVQVSLSDEGKEHYRNSIQQGGQDSYETIVQRREQLKNQKISFTDYSYEISRRAAKLNNDAADIGKSILSAAEKADNYVKAYAEIYDEIVRGYEDGTREIYVADGDGTRKLTKDEELSSLDAAYRKTVDSFVEMERTNQHAREIIGKEAEKISKISRRPTSAANFLKEQKARGTDKVPENLNEKMLSAVASFKEKYAVFNRCGF